MLSIKIRRLKDNSRLELRTTPKLRDIDNIIGYNL